MFFELSQFSRSLMQNSFSFFLVSAQLSLPAAQVKTESNFSQPKQIFRFSTQQFIDWGKLQEPVELLVLSEVDRDVVDPVRGRQRALQSALIVIMQFIQKQNKVGNRILTINRLIPMEFVTQ
ncbi:Hypothetical_protein [Hexamita inflata]|uniref:Hypothetical_protein n=1 Tax=Hexamita inflata TaxID=28002 RepID=A0ABP1IZR6_9EUKA